MLNVFIQNHRKCAGWFLSKITEKNVSDGFYPKSSEKIYWMVLSKSTGKRFVEVIEIQIRIPSVLGTSVRSGN